MKAVRFEDISPGAIKMQTEWAAQGMRTNDPNWWVTAVYLLQVGAEMLGSYANDDCQCGSMYFGFDYVCPSHTFLAEVEKWKAPAGKDVTP